MVALDELGVATSALFTLSDRSMDGTSDEVMCTMTFVPIALSHMLSGADSRDLPFYSFITEFGWFQ